MTSIINPSARSANNIKMKSNNFPLIENYQNFVKSMNDGDCDVLGLDQEVPISFCETNDMDQDTQQPMIYNMPNFLTVKQSPCYDNVESNDTYVSGRSSSSSNIPTFVIKEEVMSCSSSMPNLISYPLASSSSSSLWLSSSSSPSLNFLSQPLTTQNSSPSPFSTSLPSSSPEMFTSSESTSLTCSSYSSSLLSTPTPTVIYNDKPKTYITERGGSGCTVLTQGSNFTDMLSSRNNEEAGLEYIDLDRLPELSLYDDYTAGEQKDQTRDVPLEMGVNMMINIMEHDRKKLNLPRDPQNWTNMEVSRWIKWVCNKDQVRDISPHLIHVSGAILCSSNPESFKSQFGKSGASVMQELDLWKAANMLNTSLDNSTDDVSSGLQNSFMESSQVYLTPSTSPAPSNGSSNSQDSQAIFNSGIDNSEDDVFYSEREKKFDINNLKNSVSDKGSNISRPPFKATGRGHKKAMKLWEFLLGLLVGPDNNSDCIRWLNRDARIFKIEDSKKVATLWGKVKSRPAMNYDKLSRSVRQYYKKGIIKKPTQTKRLVYQFCPGIC